MDRITETVTIDAPADAVWAVISDYPRDPEWRGDVLTMEAEPVGPVQVGTVTHEVVRVGGRTYRNDGLVLRVDAGRRFEWRTTAGADAHGARTVEPLDEHRCQVTMEVEVVPHGINRLLAPVLRPMLVKGLRRDLAALAGIVGAPTTTGAS